MKTKLLKTILALMLVLIALPMMGQDYLTVFFKKGNKESFYLGAVKNFYVSKYDTLGVIHNDYQSQIIETTKKTFVYDLAEIDSVSFTKFNEQQVKKNFASALSASDAVFSKCDSIGDLSKYINELKEEEGIEYVSYNDNSLFVSVKDWITIVYYFDTPDTTMSEKSARSLKKTIRKGEDPIKQYGSPYKDFSAVEAIAHSPLGVHGSDEEDYFEPLKKEFEDCHILVKPVYPSLSNNFYTEEIFKHDIVFYSGHGGYDKISDLHSLQTADEYGIRPRNYVLTEKDVSDIYDIMCSQLNTDAISDDEIQIGSYKDFRSNGWVKVYGASVTQKFIENSPNEFSEPAIVYIAACKTLSENYKMADIFLKKGALAYFGSANKQSGGVLVGKSFFENLLNGMSMESARQSINWLQSTLTAGDWVTADYNIVYDPSDQKKQSHLSDQKKQFHLFHTYTKPVVPSAARAEYLDNRKATITGVTTLLDTDDPKVKFGFRYGKESDNLDKTIKGKHDSSIVDELGNFSFTAKIDLSDYQNYYFQAYTDDGYCYNVGDIQQIKFFDDDEPVDLELSAGSFCIDEGKSTTIYIIGNGEYEILNGNEKVTKVTLEGDKLVIEAIGAGESTIIVTDKKTGKTVSITVTVTSKYDDLQLSTTKLSLVEGSSGTVEITAGSGEYGVTNLNSDIAKATLNGTTITIQALAVGDAKVVVTDVKTGQKKIIEVTVTKKTGTSDIALSTQEVYLNVGETKQIEVTAGSGHYSVWIYAPEVANVTVNGNIITIKGLSSGKTIVKVTDTTTNKTIPFGIEVKGPSANEKDAVDLGLSVKWAKMNVGAVSEEDCGEHYAWGETESKSYFSWSSYDFCNGTESTISKYNNVDGKTMLDPSNDAAHVIMGGNWRTPTLTEMEELVNRCKWTVETLNGVKGARVTGPNGNSIFLPFGGQMFEDQLSHYDNSGYYYVSTLSDQGEKYAPVLCCFGNGNIHQFVNYARYYGLSIRGVLSK